MCPRVFVFGVLLSSFGLPMHGQMMGSSAADAPQTSVQKDSADSEMQPPDPAQKRAAQTFAAKARVKVTPPVAKAVVLTPLSQRERALQLLDRFTFGARPGEVDRVLALGTDNWLEQQLNPGSIPDNALNRRLGDYPTIGMSSEDALKTFPDRGLITAVADGKVPMPSDPLLAAMYEVQVYKLQQERDVKKANGSSEPRPEPTDAEKDALKKQGQATAARIAGELFALPKNQRMAALLNMPITDRIAFTSYVAGDQRNLLLADFTPREREAFNGMSGQVNSSYYIGNELAQARVMRDVLTERQLQEVMTDFWFNHFNVFLNKDSDQWYTTTYERDVIRKNALGTFHDLLLATAESPAMMVYLDNFLSIGPDSIANGVDPKNPNAKKGARGLNENYGREVMELHTLSVNGGYSQADVTHLSSILTGWGVDRPNQAGPFMFDQKRHEPGDKQWLGHTIKEGRKADGTPDGMAEGLEALKILAASPKTAHFISYLLAQRFVADTPPPALVDRLTNTYLSTNGDIKTILRALIASPEFNSRQYFRNKVKTPVEFIASAFRSTGTDPVNPGALVNVIKTMGMPLYSALPPTGYYITADQWMNSAALVDRLNFAYQLANNKFANQKFDAPKLLAMGLLLPASPGATGGVRPVGTTVPSRTDAHLMGVAAISGGDDARASAAGADVALRVLEATMIGGTVSPQTNLLIHKQLDQQPPNASATDTLNLLTALVMGSPEFQLR
jgi:uncharacterized protein (DUF1800 family)